MIHSLAYSFLSISMLLCNKYLSEHITHTWILVLFQTMFASVVNIFLVSIGIIPLKHGIQHLSKIFLLSLIFAGMLYTNMNAISNLSVPTLIVFKNAGIALTLYIDWYVNLQTIFKKSVICVCILVFSAILSGKHDLDFNIVGLFWVLTNLALQTSFSIFSKQIQQKHEIPPIVLSVFNNVFTSIILSILFVPTCEYCWISSKEQFLNMQSTTKINLIGSGFLGIFFGPCTFWCIAKTSPSHVAILGALNKIPLAILSSFIFKTQITRDGWFFIGTNLLSALVYVVNIDAFPGASTLFGYKRVSLRDTMQEP